MKKKEKKIEKKKKDKISEIIENDVTSRSMIEEPKIDVETGDITRFENTDSKLVAGKWRNCEKKLMDFMFLIPLPDLLHDY